jgi:ubiquinone/menaquinone biosynthesis C-methylase UbiE
VAAHLALRSLSSPRPEPDRSALGALTREYESLLARDLDNVERGLYPTQLLFQMPLRDYAMGIPRLLLEIPRAWLRARRRNWRDLPADVEPRDYPAYFRRTFHWQTDGYLSRRSAELYDLGVEFLFIGCADVMRRQVIPPMTRFARRKPGRLRILDVGCGTGRALAQVARALPGHRYFGVDLSPYYLAVARERLSGVSALTLAAENAEDLPFRDGWFDVVTSVYLFHELPRRARRKAMTEMARVLRPGGLLVIEDSAQLAEASDLAFFLNRFAADMHEPFYRDYVRDDLEGLVAEAALEPAGTERCWLAKVVTATKPA